MQAPNLLPLAAATAVLCALAAPATAQRRSVGGGWVNPPAGGGMHGHRGFAVPFFYPEREVVVVEREVIREVPPEPPAPPRKPYLIGASYASLPGGCMKMIEAGGTYFYCGGEWYRQVGGGYRAVAQP